MEQTLKDKIYQADDIHAKLLKTLESDQKILPENKEAVRKYLNNKAAEGITTVRLNIIFAGLRGLKATPGIPHNAMPYSP